jgi:hypothetical protein
MADYFSHEALFRLSKTAEIPVYPQHVVLSDFNKDCLRQT